MRLGYLLGLSLVTHASKLCGVFTTDNGKVHERLKLR